MTLDRLVRTKLSVPAPGPRLVPRPRLYAPLQPGVPGTFVEPREAFAEGLEARLVLVSAPAGFGKSTFLADWIAASGLDAAWLALDAADNDPVRFARYLQVAALTLPPGDGPSGGAATDAATDATMDAAADGATDPLAAAANVVEWLAERRRPALLVLDDYHVITSPRIHEAVALLVERLPAGTRLAIATRADPPLPLARLRARRELFEVRADALRFDDEEAASLLRDRLGLALTDAEVRELASRTEGWAAALQLAALSIRGRSDAGDLVRAFGASHRFILDFVTDEVLAGVDAATREFLLRTSILERLTGPLCDALTGRSDGRAALESLERANLLIVPLDDERRWYRYHHLFGELLRARLAIERPELPAALHGAASAWLEATGDVDGAMEHALSAGDSGRAVRLLRSHWLAFLHSGELWTVQHWLDRLPDAAVRGDAQLSAVYAWTILLRGESAGVGERLDDAERALGGDSVAPFDRLIVPAQIDCLRSRLADLSGDPAAAVAHARRALDRVPADGLTPAQVALLRGDALTLLAHGLVGVGDRDAAAAAYREALALLHLGGNVLAASHSVYALARIDVKRGRPEAALEIARLALESHWDPGAAGVGTPASAAAREHAAQAAVHVALAEALLALGLAGEARREAERGAELARRGGDGPMIAAAGEVLEQIAAASAQPAPQPTRQPAPQLALVEPLTARELEVLRLVAAGHSNRQIAGELFVALGTAKAHVHSLSGKLGATNRVEAIAIARRAGLID